MRWGLVFSAALAFVLIIMAVYKPSEPMLTSPADISSLVEIVRADPQLLAEVSRFLSEAGLNITIKTPPKPKPTELSLLVNSSEVVAGGFLEVRGALTSNNRPLVNETVAIFIEGRAAAVVSTDGKGVFKAVVRISVYKPLVNITAVYIPLPGSAYLPSRASVAVRVLYNKSELQISAPEVVLWGSPVEVNISQQPPVARMAIVRIGNGTWSYEVKVELRSRAIVYLPTWNLGPGVYNISVYAPGTGVFAPAYAVGRVKIEALTPQMSLRAPQFIVAGLPVNVEAVLNPPLNFTILLANREFKGAVPLDISTGFVNLVAVSRPKPPFALVSASATVFVINPVQLAVVAVAGLVAYKMTFAQRRGGVKEVAREVLVAVKGRVLPISAKEVVDALAFAFFKAGERAGIRYQRTWTYREYASMVAPYVKSVDCLWRVVHLAEKTLYSTYVPTSVEIRDAWACAEQL
ncbi:hypothetical protein [Pyrobaculum aerophilum]|uniref:hypothetical protein n=1 Tax=Pyrobaculum aerophilum TaxID=13773 RepID=UPI0023F04602|nr:hypothetical protein [Pyrobaculum aerophilum]MCX8137759.1 hypothetical protein [Pyrobaculum aerophilum]